MILIPSHCRSAFASLLRLYEREDYIFTHDAAHSGEAGWVVAPIGKGWRECWVGVDVEGQRSIKGIPGGGGDALGGSGGCKVAMKDVSDVGYEIVRECVGIVGVNGGIGYLEGRDVGEEGVVRGECRVVVRVGNSGDREEVVNGGMVGNAMETLSSGR